ncbi:hypothetical protein RIF29_27891 [Crotalaria pallida]|uniref:Uncharacterized protein n=1 Tax=Crotalaria pallida TaxID=3830 RepID=A0AAN9I0V6_CROPI
MLLHMPLLLKSNKNLTNSGASFSCRQLYLPCAKLNSLLFVLLLHLEEGRHQHLRLVVNTLLHGPALVLQGTPMFTDAL